MSSLPYNNLPYSTENKQEKKMSTALSIPLPGLRIHVMNNMYPCIYNCENKCDHIWRKCRIDCCAHTFTFDSCKDDFVDSFGCKIELTSLCTEIDKLANILESINITYNYPF